MYVVEMRSRAWLLSALVACGPEGSPSSDATPLATHASSTSAASATPSENPILLPPRFYAEEHRFTFTTLAIPLGESRDVIDPEPFDAALRNLEGAFARCAPGVGEDERIWMVARLDTNGELRNVNVGSSRFGPDRTSCIAGAFERAKLPVPPVEIAISVVARRPHLDLRWPRQPEGGGHGSPGLFDSTPPDSTSGPNLGGQHKSHEPRVKIGTLRVFGSLPADVVGRVIKMNLGRARRCYEGGLLRTPDLQGRVVVHLTVGHEGTVSKAVRDLGTTFPDGEVVSCVVKSFGESVFPPFGGQTDIGYSIRLLLPSDVNSPPPVPTKRIAIGGVALDALTADGVVETLAADVRGFTAEGVTLDTTAIAVQPDVPGPFVVFVEFGGEVLALSRVRGPGPGESAPSLLDAAVVERVDPPPGAFALRIIGSTVHVASELADRMIAE